MKEFNVPIELEEELARLNKRNKLYTWLLIGLVVILAVLFINSYKNQRAAENYLSGLNGVQNGSPLTNNFTNPGAASGGCGSGGSGGSGGGCGSGKATPITNPELEQQALDLYKSEAGNIEGVKALVTDFGCHQQVDIVDSGKNLLKSYRYQGGQLIPVG